MDDGGAAACTIVLFFALLLIEAILYGFSKAIYLMNEKEIERRAQEENDNRLFVVFADFLAERYINNADRKRELESIIADKTGKQVEVRFMLAADEGAHRGKLASIDIDERIREFIHADIEIEDEN